MGRPLLVACVAALALAAGASASLQPIERDHGDRHIPGFTPAPVVMPVGHADGLVTVLVALRRAPLAAYRSQRAPAAHSSTRRLDVRSALSRAYLRVLAAEQQAARHALRDAIPSAHLGRSFRVVLNAITVRLPVRKLPALTRLGFIRTVYPSLRFTLMLDRSPSLIGATQLQAATGTRGEGVKIAVVDDGIDQKNPFFDPAGFAYPAGFPRGESKFTSTKVIVARSYPAPNSGNAGKIALDRTKSFHGTHVAGIAAGDAGTTAPAGPDHPRVEGLSGVAPRAWLGNYRVFNAPTPAGNSAFTPQIVAAFEDAVLDGMDVINFSGGGPQNDPGSDALVEVVANVSAAGVVPVISAGNDRDDFGLGSVGAPGTALDSISVAAVTNTHVFAPALTVAVPAGLPPIPFKVGASSVPPAWATAAQPLIDVTTITGTDGKPVDRYLCAPASNVNQPTSTLPPGSLTGVIVLVSRGICSFASKARRAASAGAIGILLADNRPGDPNGIPVAVPLPAAMVADLDGVRLRDAVAAAGGRASVRFGQSPQEIETGRSGVPTSFSSAGPTSFGHDLKPDVSAPGASILSSTLREYAGAEFASFDGTSMAAPHVTGAVALLVQRHPDWTPRQVKSALMSTAAPAYGDTGRTTEAPVYLEGAGMIDVVAADRPLLFTDPGSFSFHYLDVTGGAVAKPLVALVSDQGDGTGTWFVELHPQAVTDGAAVDVPATVTVPPAGQAVLGVVARASAAAQPGENYGFIVLRRGTVTRRIPYYFSVTRPGLRNHKPIVLERVQRGDTRTGTSLASVYRYPTAPFGPAPNYVGQPLVEDGAEQVFVTHLTGPVTNIGVAVVSRSSGAQIDPFYLGSLDENDVQGYTGTPANVNSYTRGYRTPVGAAGVQFPRPGQYFISVDSGRDVFDGHSLAGSYVLRSWVDDVTPPSGVFVTKAVPAGRPTLVVQVHDLKSGVDPSSLVISYSGVSIAPTAYDPVSGVAVFPVPQQAPKLKGRVRMTLIASDYQEAKNVDQAGEFKSILPNTLFLRQRVRAVQGPTVAWVLPTADECVPRTRVRLVAAASAAARVRNVSFYDGDRRIGTVKRPNNGLYDVVWGTRTAASGGHPLRVVVVDAKGKHASALRIVMVCAPKP